MGGKNILKKVEVDTDTIKPKCREWCAWVEDYSGKHNLYYAYRHNGKKVQVKRGYEKNFIGGFTGMATCLDGDTFNLQRGINLAMIRSLRKEKSLLIAKTTEKLDSLCDDFNKLEEQYAEMKLIY